jgi:hypothetical protein
MSVFFVAAFSASAMTGAPSTAARGLSEQPAALAQAIAQAVGAAAPNGSYTQKQELQPSDPSPSDFGYGVVLSGDGHTALVGAPNKNSGQGAAYIFTQQGSTWTEQQELVASDPTAASFFGASVALSDDGHIALIGAFGKNGSQGAAYIFAERGSTYTQQQEVTASDGISGDDFSWSVSLSNDGHIALIGARGKNSYRGAAYIFSENGKTYTQQQELVGSDSASSDEFGFSAVLSDDGHIALIGAPAHNAQKGAAYIFAEHGNTYTQQQELMASDGASGDLFGYSVAVNNNGQVALISAPPKNGNQGVAYAFTESNNTYTQQVEVTDPDAASGDYFGLSVALSDDSHTALIGAPRAFNGSPGIAYIFTVNGNTFTEQELTPSDTMPKDYFGYSVTLSNDGHVALIGAPGKDSSTGAAYVFTSNH